MSSPVREEGETRHREARVGAKRFQLKRWHSLLFLLKLKGIFKLDEKLERNLTVA